MQFPQNYSTEQKIKSLSERLGYLARDTNVYRLHVDQKVKSENLQYNLSLILSRIILKLHFIDRSKAVFIHVIEDYNKLHSTNLTFQDFEKLHYIRNVADEIVLPEVIRHFVWNVGDDEKSDKVAKIPKEKFHVIKCLQLYYNKYFVKSFLTIEPTELESILEAAAEGITIQYLISKGIIAVNQKSYKWQHGEYARHLRNEIASTLWLQIGGPKATITEFRRYFKLLQGAQIFPDDLQHYLDKSNTIRICELALTFLKKEKDLLKSAAEFDKIRLDSQQNRYFDLEDYVPVITFNYNSPFEFIESVDYHSFRFSHLFDYQQTRSYCHLLLRLVVQNDPKHPAPFQNSLQIIRNTSQPFLLLTLYNDISKEFPSVIPYLLTDTELIPLGLKLTDQIQIDQTLLQDQSDNDKKTSESSKYKNVFWIEMLDFILDQVSSEHHLTKEHSVMFARIFTDIADKVFRNSARNSNGIIEHHAYQKRYNDALRRFGAKRITKFNTYPKPLISPRLLFFILPDMSAYLIENLLRFEANQNQYLNLKSGLFDLCIEILRLSKTRAAETEITDIQFDHLNQATDNLILALRDSICQFYTAETMTVVTYDELGVAEKAAVRGTNEFGFEIIDWGFLYLNFEIKGLLSDFNISFQKSLLFNVSETKYDDQNKEQSVKIKLYLKSMMLAFISINQKKGQYEIDGLPVTITMSKLQEVIIQYSLQYSTDAISERKIDVFDERLNIFGYDLYYQHLTNLLYKCVNYFTVQSQEQFVSAFFADSLHIGKMLTAINILDSKKLRDIISDRIATVDIEAFIKITFTTTELEFALIEAINSENHWELAKPLINRIKKHFENIRHHRENIQDFLFEINLLLAFKEKDFATLSRLEIPKRQYNVSSQNVKGERMKKFFIALFKLYNDKEYVQAVILLKSLLSEDPKNIKYAFHLYRAETLNAIAS